MLELLRDTWTRIQADLRTRAGDAAFDAWLGGLRPLALERGTCYLEGKNRLLCERVQRLFQPMLEEVLSAEFGTKITVNLVPTIEAAEPGALEVGPTQPIIDASCRTAGLVLSSLLEGKTLHARQFFFYGPASSGKTFWLRWWASLTEPRPRMMTGEGIVKAFQVCMRESRITDLRHELEEDRPLVLDEIHRIAGYRRLQRELLSALKARQALASPTLLASRWHPNDIWNLDPDVASFWRSGFVARLEHPSLEGRLRFLRALEGAPSRNGRASDIESLARQVRGGYGEVRRAWSAQRQGHGYPSRYLQLIDPRKVFERLLGKVAEHLQVDPQAIVGPGQDRRVSFARQVLSYLCVQEGLSRAEVGRFLGGRSRAAVSYGTKALEQRMADSPEVRAQVEEIL